MMTAAAGRRWNANRGRVAGRRLPHEAARGPPSHDQERQIGFKALCDGGLVARSSRLPVRFLLTLGRICSSTGSAQTLEANRVA